MLDVYGLCKIHAFNGHEAIREYFERAGSIIEGTAHFLVNVDIAVTGDEARASSRVLASHLVSRPGPSGPGPAVGLALIGTYDDRLRRLPQGWRITVVRSGALVPAASSWGSLPDAFHGFGGDPRPDFISPRPWRP